MSAGLAYTGAASNRFFGDWSPVLSDVNDEIAQDGRDLAARAWDLYRNDPYARALVVTLVGGVLGPEGLPFRSLYAVDDASDTTDDEKATRREIEGVIRRATLRKRFDAGGQMTRREMSAAMLVSRIVHGDAFAVRVFKPDRPDAYQGTCWRLIDPARVSNPNDAQDTDKIIQGVELDGDGAPVALHIRSTHPNLVRTSGAYKWTRVPFYSADGSLNAIHFKRSDRPDQVRGVSEFASNIRILKYLSDITWFWVIAKKMQASNCIIIECDDPKAAAAADRNGAVLTGAAGIKPGMKYYVKTGWKIHLVNTQFQGADYKDFRNANLEAAAAPWGIPYEMALCVLTGTNLSASRAALGQFDQTCQRWRAELVHQVEQPWHESILREAHAFKTIRFGTTDFDLISKGRYLPPPKIDPDRLKTAQAAREWILLGRSLSSVFGEAGYPLEEEVAQRAQDNAYMEDQHVSTAGQSAAAPAPAVPPAADKVADKDEPANDDDGNDDADKTETADDKVPA